jgi:hypothetical protein
MHAAAETQPAEAVSSAPPAAKAQPSTVAPANTEQPPSPSLEELAPLDYTADLTRFLAKGVDEVVRRAALRKLFSDPRFNVMDGLDTYIDDYNVPSPVPPRLLARLRINPNLGLGRPQNVTSGSAEPATTGQPDRSTQHAALPEVHTASAERVPTEASAHAPDDTDRASR